MFYQIYPLGACGAPFENDHVKTSRIGKVKEWIPHLKKLGVQGILFNPLMESSTHGYDTVDFEQVDARLGSNEDLAEVCASLKEEGFQILFDGVFNHVGREFGKFQDVLKNRENSPYKDWFRINFQGNDGHDDHLWYENWEGHEELVKLNLQNPEVREYLFSVIQGWIDEYGIDGLRLDVAYCLDKDFLKEMRRRFPDLFLMGETLHGDYNQWVNPEMLDSCTNYECYKGLHSSFNSHNLFEILYSFNRQFGKDPWCLYTGKKLWSFVDNHDVDRIASKLEDKKHLPLIYTMLFGMPGIPCVYYGSEWGMEGVKNNNDTDLRKPVDMPEWNELTDHIAKLAEIRKNEPALEDGDYTQIGLSNEACIFSRKKDGEEIWVAVNMKDEPLGLGFNGSGKFQDLLTGETFELNNFWNMPASSSFVLKRI